MSVGYEMASSAERPAEYCATTPAPWEELIQPEAEWFGSLAGLHQLTLGLKAATNLDTRSSHTAGETSAAGARS